MSTTRFILSEHFSSEEEAARKEAFRAILTEYLSHPRDDSFEEPLGTPPRSHELSGCD